jgi:uncharacterized UBP type Zn finger protein
MVPILAEMTQQPPIVRKIAEVLEARPTKKQTRMMVQLVRNVTEDLQEKYEAGVQYDAAEFVSSALLRVAAESKEMEADIFTTELHSILSCQTCKQENPAQIFHYTQHTMCTHWMKPTLEESIKAYLSPCSMQPGTRVLGCKCTTIDAAIVKQNVILRNPLFIVFRLVRGVKDDADTKDSAVLVYPPILDFNGEHFKLKSVCVHVGESVTNGHYWTICEGDDGFFHKVDDLEVTKVEGPSGDQPSTEAYLLCYKKCLYQTCG